MLEYIALANNNKLLWGLSMLLLNIGSRFVVADLGVAHEKILSSQIVKKIIVFSLFFVATRDVIISFVLTLIYIIIIDGILHERSKFCIVPEKVINPHKATNTHNQLLETYKKNVSKVVG